MEASADPVCSQEASRLLEQVAGIAREHPSAFYDGGRIGQLIASAAVRLRATDPALARRLAGAASRLPPARRAWLSPA